MFYSLSSFLRKCNDVFLDRPSLTFLHRAQAFLFFSISSLILKYADMLLITKYKSFLLVLFRLALNYTQYYSSFAFHLTFKRRYLRVLSKQLLATNKNLPFECSFFSSSILSNDFTEIFPLTCSQINNLRYLEPLFSHKNILALGPSVDLKSYCAFDFDVICVLNSYPMAIELSESYPDQTIVSFINIGYYRRNKHKFTDYPANLVLLIKPPCSSPNFTNYLVPDSHMVLGGPMGMQCLLFTLLHCRPNSIYLSGANAYLINQYKAGIKNYPPNISHMINNLRRHEPISNYAFISFCVSRGYVQTDNNTFPLLSLSLDEYCKQLDCMYPDLGYSKVRLNLHSH